MKRSRHTTRVVRIGSVRIGGTHPVAIQSMTKTKTRDVEQTVAQIKRLEACGCEIVRLAVKDTDDAAALKPVKRRVRIPLVADIHFNPALAIAAIENGVDKIRLNPGNLRDKKQLGMILRAAKAAGIPIRIGVNSGSVADAGRDKGMPERLVRGALEYIRFFEKNKFHDIVLSLKASNVPDTVEAYRRMAERCDYPLHLGITATGTPFSGAIKTAVGLGILLSEGIGDTLRVSLTDTPEQEVYAAQAILESLHLRVFGQDLISCPTCGRCDVNLVDLVKDLEKRIAALPDRGALKGKKIAVMGCVVNGPGEAREADIGIAFGLKEGLLFKKGKAVRKIPFGKCADVLMKELKNIQEAGHAAKIP